MTNKMKIATFEVENVKRVKAVHVEPSANGLTILGGNNNQGKTSVLDALAWALGGNKLKPSNPKREGSMQDPHMKITMSNGLVVERAGKNSDLKVIDPNGEKSGQRLLDQFINELALNIPKFINSSSKDKANTLLNIIGVGDKLYELEVQEERKFNERTAIGVTRKQKDNYAKELVFHEGMPDEVVSVSDLVQQQQAILARNGENNSKRRNLEFIESDNVRQREILEDLKRRLAEQESVVKLSDTDLETAKKSALDLHDESTAELEASISNVEETNRKVRENLDREKALDEAEHYKFQYEELTEEIEAIRGNKMALLKGADLPLPGLSVHAGELTYNGQNWDGMSGSQQLKVATSIVRKLQPDCGFVLLDKLEQFDLVQLQEFGQWLETEGLQAIATRVSTGEECSIIIEDGYVVGQEVLLAEEPKEEVLPSW